LNGLAGAPGAGLAGAGFAAGFGVAMIVHLLTTFIRLIMQIVANAKM
jgi:hypothetical protein